MTRNEKKQADGSRGWIILQVGGEIEPQPVWVGEKSVILYSFLKA